MMGRVFLTVALSFLLHIHAACAAAAVEITNLSDLSLPAWSIGDPAVTAHMDVCVYSVGGTTSSGYVVTATSSGGFYLVNGTHKIPYQLYWEDDGTGNLGTSTGTGLTSGSALTGQVNANILSPLCVLGTTGPDARLNLKIAQTDMTNALAGTYQGTVTILVSPN